MFCIDCSFWVNSINVLNLWFHSLCRLNNLCVLLTIISALHCLVTFSNKNPNYEHKLVARSNEKHVDNCFHLENAINEPVFWKILRNFDWVLRAKFFIVVDQYEAVVVLGQISADQRICHFQTSTQSVLNFMMKNKNASLFLWFGKKYCLWGGEETQKMHVNRKCQEY